MDEGDFDGYKVMTFDREPRRQALRQPTERISVAKRTFVPQLHVKTWRNEPHVAVENFPGGRFSRNVNA